MSSSQEDKWPRSLPRPGELPVIILLGGNNKSDCQVRWMAETKEFTTEYQRCWNLDRSYPLKTSTDRCWKTDSFFGTTDPESGEREENTIWTKTQISLGMSEIL